MVYDCFLFFNELDLLEFRLNELNEYVDRFVLLESNTTFSGNPKPMYFQENRVRYKKFEDKIIYIPLVDDQSSLSVWDREHFQRLSIKRGLVDCADDDVIIISDLDEIPKLENIDIVNLASNNLPVQFVQSVYYFYFNLKLMDGWFGSICTMYKSLRDKTIVQIRSSESVKINDGGWHFSFLGSISNMVAKLESYSHQEYNNENIKSNLPNCQKNNLDPFGRGNLELVEINQSFPKHLLNNLDKYKHLIKPL